MALLALLGFRVDFPCRHAVCPTDAAVNCDGSRGPPVVEL